MPGDERTLDEFGLDAAKRAELGLVGLVEAISSLLVMYFACFLVFIFGLAQIMSRHSAPWGPWLTDLAIWALLVVGSAASAAFIKHALRRATRPVLPSIAMQQRMPLIMRPFVGTWWLVAAGCVVLLAHAQVGAFGWFGPSWKAHAVKYGFTLFVVFITAVASNAYMLLGVWSFTRSAFCVTAIWKLRFAIDLLLALVIPALDPQVTRYFQRLMGP